MFIKSPIVQFSSVQFTSFALYAP